LSHSACNSSQSTETEPSIVVVVTDERGENALPPLLNLILSKKERGRVTEFSLWGVEFGTDSTMFSREDGPCHWTDLVSKALGAEKRANGV
jgi:hypothetical protein